MNIRDMIWDASVYAGTTAPGASREEFNEGFDAAAAVEDPEHAQMVAMMTEFGRLYSAEIEAELQRQIEALSEELHGYRHG